MYSPLVLTPSRPPPPDPTAEPASGSRGALPHRIAPRWGGTWPDGSGHYGQWSKGKAGKDGWEGGAVGGVAPRAHGHSRDGGSGARLSPQCQIRCVRVPQEDRGVPVLSWKAPVDGQRREPNPAPRIPAPGAFVPGFPCAAPGLRVPSFSLLALPPRPPQFAAPCRTHPRAQPLETSPLPSPTSGPGVATGSPTSSLSCLSTEGLCS